MPRVLVVDDTASIRFLIRTNLELAGFEVDEAVDGVQCLEILGRLDVMPDVITASPLQRKVVGCWTVKQSTSQQPTKKKRSNC